jgi:PAP2 superfamily
MRPGLSFPSGHDAQAAIVGYAVLLLVLLPLLGGGWRRTAVTLAVFMVLAIGFSRVALGVHYLSEVVGGFVLGAAWVAAVAAAFNAMRVDRGCRALDVREVWSQSRRRIWRATRAARRNPTTRSSPLPRPPKLDTILSSNQHMATSGSGLVGESTHGNVSRMTGRGPGVADVNLEHEADIAGSVWLGICPL